MILCILYKKNSITVTITTTKLISKCIRWQKNTGRKGSNDTKNNKHTNPNLVSVSFSFSFPRWRWRRKRRRGRRSKNRKRDDGGGGGWKVYNIERERGVRSQLKNLMHKRTGGGILKRKFQSTLKKLLQRGKRSSTLVPEGDGDGGWGRVSKWGR